VLSPFEWALAAFVTFCAATVQGTIGFGLGVVSIPVLTIIDPALTPIPQLMMSLPLALATAWRERSDVDSRGLGLITVGRVPGALAGAWILTALSDATLGIIIGLVVLTAVVVIRAGWTIPINTGTRLGAGLAAGFTGTSAGIGGPPVALLYRSSGTAAARSTVAAAIAIGIVVNLTVLHVVGAVARTDYIVAGALLAPTALGFVVSTPLRRLIDDDHFRAIVLVLSSAAAIVLIVRNLFF
jgi:uncharacterized membrane protein YfcA